tara:strand:- start:5405 stop:5728 length:324 start_codon:yes stop_codon:yes gene_type:complete
MFNKKTCIPCQGGIPPMTHIQILEFQKLVSDNWIVSDNKKLIREFKFDSYVEAIKFSNLVAKLSEEQAHHPFIHINFKKVKVILFTHKINGLHENDFLMASKIDHLK